MLKFNGNFFIKLSVSKFKSLKMENQLFKLSLALALVITVQSYVRICYYTNWSQYRNGIGKYSLTRHYEKGLCTHLIFSFAKVVNSNSGYTIDQYEWNDKSDLYERVRFFFLFLLESKYVNPKVFHSAIKHSIIYWDIYFLDASVKVRRSKLENTVSSRWLDPWLEWF